MNNEFTISIRLTSDLYDFSEFRDKTYSNEFTFRKKGESRFKNQPADSPFRARSNVFLFNNVYKTNNLEKNFDGFVNKCESLMHELSVLIDTYNFEIKKVIWVSCQLNKDQFRFSLTPEFVRFVSKYGYTITISGIAYSDD